MTPASASQSRAERSAAVFGGSGGIGAALVRQLAATGSFSTIHAGSQRAAEGLPAGVKAFRFSLTDEVSIADAAAAFAPPPDLVIVASGLLHDTVRNIAPEKSLRSINPAAMAALFAANTIGPALIAKHCLPRLPRDRPVVFAVLAAKVGSITDNRRGGWHSYRASKAALNMLVKGFAIELARSHPLAVAVALHPGTVDSRLSAPFQRGVPPGKMFSPDQAAGHMLGVIDRLTPADSGALLSWDGTRLPY